MAAGGTASSQSPYGVELAGGDPGAIPAVAEGRAGVQDEGSQLVALALAAAPVDGRDERWLDLCAGPGGKAALLAALAAERGARLLAVRAAAAPRRPGAPGDRARPRPAWPASWWPTAPARAWARGTFDRVLVDAPCSGSVRCAGGRRRAGGVPPPTSTRWSRCSAPCSPPRSTRPARGSGALRDLLAGAWPRPPAWSRGARRARRRRAPRRGRPPLPAAAVRGALGPPARGTCSCGRTATAPTRCSSPSSAGAEPG